VANVYERNKCDRSTVSNAYSHVLLLCQIPKGGQSLVLGDQDYSQFVGNTIEQPT
jgi:hypothetical protein